MASWSAWLTAICPQEQLDLVFPNAGVNTNIGSEHEGEHWEAVEDLPDINTRAAIAP